MMLPIIITDATEDIEPEYSMDPAAIPSVKWAQGVELLGVRTFFYEQVYSPSDQKNFRKKTGLTFV